jgi:hypothetical protein
MARRKTHYPVAETGTYLAKDAVRSSGKMFPTSGKTPFLNITNMIKILEFNLKLSTSI